MSATSDPDLAAACRNGSLQDPVPVADTRSGRVWKVPGPQGAAALKILRAGASGERGGAALMDWWGGTGAARVRAHRDDRLLLEWLDGPPLARLVREGGDAAAAGALAGVYAALHRPRNAAPPPLVPLADWLRPLPRVRRRAGRGAAAAISPWRPGWRGGCSPPRRCRCRCTATCTTATSWRAAGVEGHRPEGLLGDPAFDLANSFRNPAGAGVPARRPRRVVRLARTYAERLGHPAPRLLGWAAVQAALSARWKREDGHPAGDDLLLLPRLPAAHAAAAGG